MKRLEGWAYLCGVSQEPEADIIVGLLNDNGIEALKDFPAAGEFLKIAYGLTGGVDIYVPEPEINRARELLEAFPGPDMYSEDGENKFLTDEISAQEIEGKEEDPRPQDAAGKHAYWSLLVILMFALLGVALLFQRNPLF